VDANRLGLSCKACRWAVVEKAEKFHDWSCARKSANLFRRMFVIPVNHTRRMQMDETLLADGFEEAFIGYFQRCGKPPVACYNYENKI